MIDIDRFKDLNDAHGHLVGDAVLREVARRIQETVRTIDVVARYGGEEFVVLMPETDLAEAVLVAERVRRQRCRESRCRRRVTVSTTISLGVAEIDEAVRQFRRGAQVLRPGAVCSQGGGQEPGGSLSGRGG